MGRGTVASKFLLILNIIYTLLGMGIVGLSVWFFIQIKNLTSLRNTDHFKLDMKMYWPEALPLIYASIGVFVVLISCCAFAGVTKKSRALLMTNVSFQVLAILALAVAATVTLLYADTEESDNFISVTIYNAFHNMKDNEDVKKEFGKLETKLQCCGPNEAADYLLFLDSNAYLPPSCCGTAKRCGFNDKISNSRQGCINVANHYVRIIVKTFAAAGAVTAIVGILSLVSAVCLSKALKNKKVRHGESDRKMHKSNVPFMVAEIEKAEKAQKAEIKV